MTDFAVFAQQIIDELTKEGRKHTADTRKHSANRILMFMGNNPTSMEKWDELFVQDYYISHASDNNPAVTIKWDKAMQQIANRYPTDTEYMFPIITKEGNADIIDQITQSRHNVMYNLRSIGKQHKFSVSPTIAMTKDLWRKIMDEVSVSEVIS